MSQVGGTAAGISLEEVRNTAKHSFEVQDAPKSKLSMAFNLDGFGGDSMPYFAK